jgi:SP family sugar:H+ symporter-like MFS transporter
VGWLEIAKAGSLRRRVIISCWLQFAQQFTGMNTIIMFSAVFFEQAHFGDPFAANMVFTALMVVGIVAGLALLDSRHGGRRAQLLAVTLVICPLLLLIGVAVRQEWSRTAELVLIGAFAFSWQVAWGMIPWVYPSELFTMAERDRATSLAVFTQYAANAVLMFVVPLLKQGLGFVGMVWFFSAFNVLNVVFILTCIKETKGIPLEHVPQLFDSARVAKAPAPALPATLPPVAECAHA